MTAEEACIRVAKPGDAEQIAAVHVRAWQAAYRGLLPQDYLDQLNPEDRLARWQRTLNDAPRATNGVLVTATDGQIRGVAWFGPSRDADACSAQVGELMGIYLLAEAWGTGLGRDLMAAAVKRLGTWYPQATLWVLDSNVRARQFYAKAGWTPDGTVKQDDQLGFPITEVRYRQRLP